MERLQKVLAHAGIASRRASERLISEGRVSVNGAIVTRLGVSVDPDRDSVKVDGRRVPAPPSGHVVILLNKPRGYVTTARDPEGRPTILDLVRGIGRRVFPVGRLDFASEGLLLLTDDGDLARDLMRPATGIEKTYMAKVRGEPAREQLARMCRGLYLEGRRTLPARAGLVRSGENAWVEVSIVEGRKHQIRKMLEAIGHPVMRLRRTRYGGVELGDLPPGRFRALSSEEIARLKRAVLAGSRGAPKRRSAPKVPGEAVRPPQRRVKSV